MKILILLLLTPLISPYLSLNGLKVGFAGHLIDMYDRANLTSCFVIQPSSFKSYLIEREGNKSSGKREIKHYKLTIENIGELSQENRHFRTAST